MVVPLSPFPLPLPVVRPVPVRQKMGKGKKGKRKKKKPKDIGGEEKRKEGEIVSSICVCRVKKKSLNVIIPG